MTPARAIVAGGLVVGALDILDAFIFFWVRSGVRPMRILQAIAAGLLGRDAAVSVGAGTAALGLGLHYGVIVYLVMNYVVVRAR